MMYILESKSSQIQNDSTVLNKLQKLNVDKIKSFI